MMTRNITLILLIIFVSCKKEDTNNIPGYIKIDNITLADNSTHNITDAWVYIDDNLQGVYELPANFPVLANGKHKLRIRGGIKENGISATRVPYPFYSSFIIEEQEFSPTSTINIEPEVDYLSIDDNSFIEDFEGVGIDLDTTSISDTIIIKFSNENNKYGGGVLIDPLLTFEIATDELSSLPQQGAPVYLELDYKCNTQFLIGVYVNFSQSVLQKDLLWINPKDNWNKIYVNLTPTISESVGAEFFKVFLGMRRDTILEKNEMYFDNIKVIY